VVAAIRRGTRRSPAKCKGAPAIAAGNAVILKPAEATPLMALELARILSRPAARRAAERAAG
jgi:acyl-CoA reductase-like NAD-dependent aldehyde dehydrogenase